MCELKTLVHTSRQILCSLKVVSLMLYPLQSIPNQVISPGLQGFCNDSFWASLTACLLKNCCHVSPGFCPLLGSGAGRQGRGLGSCGKPEVSEDEALGISSAETSSGVGNKLSTHLKPALGGLLLHDPQ